MLAAVSGPDDLDCARLHGRAIETIALREVRVGLESLKSPTRNLTRHEEGVAAARDASANLRDLSERYEARAKLAHHVEVETRGTQITAPLARRVILYRSNLFRRTFSAGLRRTRSDHHRAFTSGLLVLFILACLECGDAFRKHSRGAKAF